MTARIPVTIIGGYLGAGKTTLVNQMLRQADGARLAVLVNEFGALPIDEDLIIAQDDTLISIAGGCICCSFGSDLTAAMQDLATRDPAPDHIIIETSGVALPGAIAGSIALLPRFSVDGICVLADCAHARALSQDEYVGDTITRQFADANLLLLTKGDLVGTDALDAFRTWLTEHWPAPRQVLSRHGKVPNAILLGQFSNTSATATGGHHDAAYASVFLDCDAAVDAQTLAQTLATSETGVLRAKGFVDDMSGRRALIQIVGPRAEVTFPDEPAAPGLVCIGLAGRLDTDRLRQLTHG